MHLPLDISATCLTAALFGRPYGIITLNPRTQQYQGFAGLALFFFHSIPEPKWG
jgi:hypothetical protein